MSLWKKNIKIKVIIIIKRKIKLIMRAKIFLKRRKKIIKIKKVNLNGLIPNNNKKNKVKKMQIIYQILPKTQIMKNILKIWNLN